MGFIYHEIEHLLWMYNIFQNCLPAWCRKNQDFQHQRISILYKLDLEYFFYLHQKLLTRWMKFFWILKIRFFCFLYLVLTNRLKYRIWQQVTRWFVLKVHQKGGLSSCQTFAKFVRLPRFYNYFCSKAQYACCPGLHNF